jgi:hypothetical protein
MRLRNGAAQPPPHEASPLHPISAETAQLDNAAEGTRDVSLAACSRLYHFAGAQHSAGTLPLTDTNPVDGARGQQAFNSVNYNPLLRAALVRMDRWVTGEEDPPPSRYPRLADGTAVAPEQPREVFAAIPGVGFPLHPPQVIRLAFGPDAASGKGSRTAYPNCPTRENQIARPGAAARGKETRS